MWSPLVTYNAIKGRYEAKCPNGSLKTFFVIPYQLDSTFTMPTLHLNHKDPSKADDETNFQFCGRYDPSLGNLEFYLSGPPGHRYNLRLSASKEKQKFKWRITRKGITDNLGECCFNRRCNNHLILVPREVSIDPAAKRTTNDLSKKAEDFKWTFSPHKMTTDLFLWYLRIKISKRSDPTYRPSNMPNAKSWSLDDFEDPRLPNETPIESKDQSQTTHGGDEKGTTRTTSKYSQATNPIRQKANCAESKYESVFDDKFLSALNVCYGVKLLRSKSCSGSII